MINLTDKTKRLIDKLSKAKLSLIECNPAGRMKKFNLQSCWFLMDEDMYESS